MTEELKRIDKKINENTDYSTISPNKEIYDVTIIWDENDMDHQHVERSYLKKEFEDDTVLKLMLCYMNQYQYGDGIVDDDERFKYNHKDNPIVNYMAEKGILAYTEFGTAHSVVKVIIHYYDSKGLLYHVTLPEFDSLFEDDQEGFDILESLVKGYEE